MEIIRKTRKREKGAATCVEVLVAQEAGVRASMYVTIIVMGLKHFLPLIGRHAGRY